MDFLSILDPAGTLQKAFSERISQVIQAFATLDAKVSAIQTRLDMGDLGKSAFHGLVPAKDKAADYPMPIAPRRAISVKIDGHADTTSAVVDALYRVAEKITNGDAWDGETSTADGSFSIHVQMTNQSPDAYAAAVKTYEAAVNLRAQHLAVERDEQEYAEANGRG